MITIAYGMHRTPKEILVAKMMEQFAKEPYKNLKFVNLDGKDWNYLSECAEGFAFDVHGGAEVREIDITDALKIQFINMPSQFFFIFSRRTEGEYLQFLQRYKICRIALIHKSQWLYHTGVEWLKQDFDSAMASYSLKEVERFNLEDKLLAVELLNADENWQIKAHRPFIKQFLTDLDSK